MAKLYTELDHGLSSEIIAFREQINHFSQERIAPFATDFENSQCFPISLWKEMGDLGLLGITVEEKYGGCNAGYLAHVIAMEQISMASASVGLSYGAHSNLCVNQIHRNGTTEQKKKYLPPLISGEKVGALAMSEAGSGSDVVSMHLQANEQNDGFILNGNKMWITNGPIADIIVVYAKTSPEKKSRGITAFIVEKHFSGFSCGPKIDKMGMRGSETCELIFQNCKIPLENVLGEKDLGVEVLMSGLDYERLVLSGGPVGIMQSCLDIALPYATERKQFNQPIAKFQLIQAKLADMYTTLSSSRSYLYAVAQAFDRQLISRKDAAAVILTCAEKATQMALETIQILGGNGYVNEYVASRLLRDAKLYEIGAGTSEIRRMLIGRELYQEAGGE